MPQIESWTVLDSFWARVEPLIPLPQRRGIVFIFASLAAAASPCRHAKSFPPSFTCCAPVANGRLFRAGLAAPAQYICTFGSGSRQASFFVCGKPDWPSMTRWKPSHGAGRASAARCTKRRWRPSAWSPTPRIGGKNGRKRNLIVGGIGVPLSLVASGANTHDVKLLEATLDRLVMEMPGRAGQYNLCADAGYKGAPALNAAVSRDYKPHIKQRREEAHDKLSKPGFKARR